MSRLENISPAKWKSLTRWAQDYIRKLESEIEIMTDSRDMVGDETTKVFFVNSMVQERIRIPESATISINVKNGRIDIHRKSTGEYVEIYTMPHTAVISPQAANHFRIMVED